MNAIKSNTTKPDAAPPRYKTILWLNLFLALALPASCLSFFFMEYSDMLILLIGIFALALNIGLLYTVRFNKHCTEREKLTAAVIGVVSLGAAALLIAAFASAGTQVSGSVVNSAICMGLCAFCYAFIGFDLFKAVRKAKSTD